MAENTSPETAATAAEIPTGDGVGAAATVDLGQKGLAPGDTIDGYLGRYFRAGNEVHVPPGTYRWNGTGLGGDYRDAALVGDGDVVFESATDVWNQNVFARGGTVLLRNVTVRGQLNSGGSKCRIRCDCRNPGATMTLDNFNLPDGDAPGGRSTGLYVGKEHRGTLNYRNGHIEGFPNNGLYAGGYGRTDGGDGEVHVENSLFRNNNVDGVRLGGTNDSIRDSVIVQEDVTRAWNGDATGRGLRIRYPGDDVTVENVHITTSEATPFTVSHRESGREGSGTVQNLFIRNDTGSTAAAVERGDWVGENVHVSGSGNANVSGFGRLSTVVQGSDATPPAASPSELDGSDSVGRGGHGSPAGDRVSTDDRVSTGSLPRALTIEWASAEKRNYTFTVDGEVEQSTGSGATITSDVAEGTVVEGTVYAGVDSYEFSGDVTGFDIDEGPTVYRDGSRVAPSTLGSEPELPHTVTIEGGSDSAEAYSIAVSGKVEPSVATRAAVDPGDGGGGTLVRGEVSWATDSYDYSGEITRLSADRSTAVWVDGEEFDPSTIGDPGLENRVVVDARGSGGATSYAVEVSGELQPSTDFPPGRGGAIEGSTVEGIVESGVVAYRYSGDLVAFDLEGTAFVVVEDNGR